MRLSVARIDWRRRGRCTEGTTNRAGQMLEVDLRAPAEREGGSQRALELADVEREVIAEQRAGGAVGEGQGCGALAAVAAQERAGEEAQVFAAIPESRKLDAEAVDAGQEIVPESTAPHEL